MTRYVYRFPFRHLSNNPLHISVRFVLTNVLVRETSVRVAGDIDALSSTIRPALLRSAHTSVRKPDENIKRPAALRLRLVGTGLLSTKEYSHAKILLA